MISSIIKLARKNPQFREYLIRKIASVENFGPEFQEFLDKKYEGGKKKVKNPNPRGKLKEVTVNTALKDPNFRKKIVEEWKKSRSEKNKSSFEKRYKTKEKFNPRKDRLPRELDKLFSKNKVFESSVPFKSKKDPAFKKKMQKSLQEAKKEFQKIKDEYEGLNVSKPTGQDLYKSLKYIAEQIDDVEKDLE